MYGAILGDIIGAPYEFCFPRIKTKQFPLFSTSEPAEGQCWFTDDTVMTVAVADALLHHKETPGEDLRFLLTNTMQFWGKAYPYAGYGKSFRQWLTESDPRPYGSFGNGSAMRVSPVGWMFNELYETRVMARATAEVSHNHIEGLRGAEAVASAIFLARDGLKKEEIADYVVQEFGYDLSESCNEIRTYYQFDETCQGTVPAAIRAFLDGENFEDCIRTAVSLGGDADTLGCITGSIAEAYYGVPQNLIEECRKRLSPDILDVVDAFYSILFPNEHTAR